MSDAADPNSAVVGVDIVNGGAQPAAPEPAPAPPDADGFDPGGHTVAEVLDYLEANPDETVAVLAAEQAGRARAGILGAT